MIIDNKELGLFEEDCNRPSIFLGNPKIAKHEALGTYIHRIRNYSWTSANLQLATKTLGRKSNLIGLCIPANIPGLVQYLGESVPSVEETRRMHTLFPLSRIVGDAERREKVEAHTMSNPIRGSRISLSRGKFGMKWALGLCRGCIEDDIKDHWSSVWHREHLLNISNVCAIHGEDIFEYCEDCRITTRHTTSLQVPYGNACGCKVNTLVARRPPTIGEREADHRLSRFVLDFLNSTELEHLSGEIFAEAVGDRLAHLGARTEYRLNYGRVSEVFRASLSHGTFQMLPDPRTMCQFSAALKGGQPFGDATTALAVAYALFGSVENLATVTRGEQRKSEYGKGLRATIRRVGGHMTPEERNERTINYLNRLGISQNEKCGMTRAEIRDLGGSYIYAWIQEFGANFLPPKVKPANKGPKADFAGRDMRMSIHVKEKGGRLRRENFHSRISMQVLLEGFPNWRSYSEDGRHNYPLTKAVIAEQEETVREWNIRATNYIIENAVLFNLGSNLMRSPTEVAMMTIRQHHEIRGRIREVIRGRKGLDEGADLMAVTQIFDERADETA